MNNGLSKILFFAAGAIVGSVATWKFVEEKYKRIADEEIESVKEHLRVKMEDFSDITCDFLRIITVCALFGVGFGNFLFVLFQLGVVAVDEVSGNNFLHVGLLHRIVMSGNGVVDDTLTLFFVVRIGQRDCRKQRFCVGVQRVRKQLVASGKFHNFAEIHNGNSVREVFYNGKVVRNKHNG